MDEQQNIVAKSLIARASQIVQAYEERQLIASPADKAWIEVLIADLREDVETAWALGLGNRS